MKIIFILMCFIYYNIVLAQWEPIYVFEDTHALRDVEFVNQDTGYIVADELIAKTEDGGNSWSMDETFIGNFRIVDFINVDTGMVCCDLNNGTDLLFTYDGGETWVNPPAHVWAGPETAVLSPDMSVYYAYSDMIFNSYVQKMINNYSFAYPRIEIGNGLPPFDITFTNADTGYVCGTLLGGDNNSTIYKTIDGGESWYTNDSMKGPIYFISFPSEEIGYGVGDERRVWKTTNAGESWHMLPFDFGFDLYDDYFQLDLIYFYNDTLGYVQGYNFAINETEIYHTTNGGNSWFKTSIPDPEWTATTGIQCVNSETCYMIDVNGIVYKTTNGGGIDTSTTISGVVNDALHIYPNPASNIIHLAGLPNTSLKTIRTTDILGREIALFFNNNLQADVSQLPPGIYFTKVETDAGSFVVKWVKVNN